MLRTSLLAVAALALLAMGTAGRGTLYGPPVGLQVSDRAALTVVNAGPRPARVELELLSLDDFSTLAASGPLELTPRTAFTLNLVADSRQGVLARIRYRTNGGTLLLPALQVVNPVGDTQIFTDGFESGNTS
jgi:hypothetical protein